MAEKDIETFLEKESIVALYFKDKKIEPATCEIKEYGDYLIGPSLHLTYTTSENPIPKTEVLTRRDRENLLAKRILEVERHFADLE